jgi:hypothetical protein
LNIEQQNKEFRIAEPVIPDELRFAGRDPESSESSMTSFGVWFPAFAGTLSGSRLASGGGLGRDDELRHSLLGEGGHVVILRS